MNQTPTLAITKRSNEKKSARDARNANLVPGVVYGHGTEPFSVSMPYSDILRTYRNVGNSALVELDVEGQKHMVLIHELKLHPVKDTIHHVDFLTVNMNEPVVASIPVHTTGISQAVKMLGGILIIDHHSVDVRCLPGDLPKEFMIDISVLANVHDHVCIKDLTIDPEKHEILNLHPGDVVVSVAGKGGGMEEAEEVVTAVEGEAAPVASE